MLVQLLTAVDTRYVTMPPRNVWDAVQLPQPTPCAAESGGWLFNNLGFVWFKEESAYTQAMSEREVPVCLEHLVRELSVINIGTHSRVVAVARALQVQSACNL